MMRPHKTSVIMNLLVLLLIMSCAKDSDIFEFAVDNYIEEEIDSNSESDNGDPSDEENSSEPNDDQETSEDSDDEPESSSGTLFFSDFGVVGDGQHDDTEALNNAVNSNYDLIAKDPLNLKISGAIEITRGGDQSIDWNNSTMVATKDNQRMIYVNKSSGVLQMNDLLLEANNLADEGAWINTPIDFENIDVKNIYSDTQTGLGFRLGMSDAKSFTDSNMNNCDCEEVNSLDDNKIGNSIGAARCFMIVWNDNVQPAVTVKVTNSIFTGVWAEDGDVVEIRDQLYTEFGYDIGSTDNKLIFENVTIENWSRRGLKGLGGGAIFKNCTFNAPEPNNPKLSTSSNLGPSGMVAVGHWFDNYAKNGTYGMSDGFVFDGCTFNGTSRESRVIMGSTKNAIITNNTFNNSADLLFYENPAKVTVCGNQFGPKSFIDDYGERVNIADIRISDNNSYAESNPIKINFFSYQITSDSCQY